MMRLLKISLIFLLVLSVCLSLCSCFARDFHCGELTVTLDAFFFELDTEREGVSMCLASTAGMTVIFIRESLSDLAKVGIDGESTACEYAELLRETAPNGAGEVIALEGGVGYFEYENSVNGVCYRYFAYCYKAKEAFFAVQFAMADEDTERLSDSVKRYAATVRIEGE